MPACTVWEPHSSLPWSFLMNLVLRLAKTVFGWRSWLLQRFSFEPGLLLAGILIKAPPLNSNFLSLLSLVTLSVSYCTQKHTHTLTHVHFHILPLWMSCVHVSEFFPSDLMSPTIQKKHYYSLLAQDGATMCFFNPTLLAVSSYQHQDSYVPRRLPS